MSHDNKIIYIAQKNEPLSEKQKSGNLNTLGFLFTPIWISIVGINCIFLAQVLEMWLSFGTRITISYIGSYDVGSLAAGIIWSLAQIAFELTSEHAEKKSKRFIALLFLVISILLESGFSFSRGQIISTAEIPDSGSLISSGMMEWVIVKGGAIGSGIFGLIVPVAQVLIGSIAWRNFIIPIFSIFFQFFGRFFKEICFGFKRFFQEVYYAITKLFQEKLPPFAKNLQKQIRKCKNELARCNFLYKTLREEKTNLSSSRPQLYETIEENIKNIKQGLEELVDQLKAEIDKVKSNINSCTNLDELRRCARERERVMMNLKQFFTFDANARAQCKLIQSPKQFKKWENKAKQFNSNLNNLKTTIAELTNNRISTLLNQLSEEDTEQIPSYVRVEFQNSISSLKSTSENLKKEIEQIDPLDPSISSPSSSQYDNIRSKVLQLREHILDNQRLLKKECKELKKDMKKKLKEFKISWLKRLWLSFTLAVALFLIIPVVCPKPAYCQLFQPSTSKCVVVLLDETGSFGLHSGSQPGFWPEIIRIVQNIVSHLHPGDYFAVIGIDDHGFDFQDVRIPFTRLPQNILRASIAKRKLINSLRRLKPRSNIPRTDIFGAIDHAAYLISHLRQTHNDITQGLVIVFSDMIQTAPLPTAQHTFPDGTTGIFLYVNARGVNQWQKLIDSWKKRLSPLNLNIQGFYQRGETQEALNVIFRLLQHY